MAAVDEQKNIAAFQQEVLQYYRAEGRKFPWRDTTDPYSILVSEIMLQQTQAERVIRRYPEFIAVYPDFHRLAAAPLSEILVLWQGLGYNRRAKGLKRIAEIVAAEHEGALPDTVPELIKLPGIGHATASSICAYAFNKPVVYIETNIRRVFIHRFFPGEGKVSDKDILPLVEASLYRKNPREWYNALMDYGVKIKKDFPDPNRRSSHYSRQSAFQGSNRQIRGRILRVLALRKEIEERELSEAVAFPAERVEYCLARLKEEGFLCAENGYIRFNDF